LHYEFIKLAFDAVAQLDRERPLDMTTAHGSGKNPAGSAAVFSIIDTFCSGFGCRRTYAQFRRLTASRLPTTLLIFPAIRFWQDGSPSSISIKPYGSAYYNVIVTNPQLEKCITAPYPVVFEESIQISHVSGGL